MRFPSLRYALLPLFAALALTACHGKDDTSLPGGSTPETAVKSSAELFKAGDFKVWWKHVLPPADYANLRNDWTASRQGQLAITDQDRARFNDAMQQLTGPDAENKLYTELQPKLTAMATQYKDQVPVMISVGVAMMKKSVVQNQNLPTEQKTQLNAALDVLAPWAQQTPWFDSAKAKQAIDIAVATARKLDLKSPDQLRTMDFDTSMAKYSIGYDGIKQLLANYGLSLDDALDSVKVTTIDNSNGHARVKVDYTLLGKPLSTESTLVQIDNRWYSEDMVNKVRQAHKQLSEPASPASTPSPAASASAPAASSVAPAPVAAPVNGAPTPTHA